MSAEALPTVRHAAALTECHLARGDLARALSTGEKRPRVHVVRRPARGTGGLHPRRDRLRAGQPRARLAPLRRGQRATSAPSSTTRTSSRGAPAPPSPSPGCTGRARPTSWRASTWHSRGKARRRTSWPTPCAPPPPRTPTAPGSALLREAQHDPRRPGGPSVWPPRSTPTSPCSSRSRGDPTDAAEAVTLLRRAEAYAGREDLFPLQSRVRRILERVGEEPRRILSETLASLTVTEQTTARLAAAGMTNREIAAELAVTVKAVEWHLSNVYRKLKIRGRTGLADTMGLAG